MAVGGTDDYFLAGLVEGTWTPTSAIIEVQDGEEYGLGEGISPPLCFVPRGIDNSTGGMKENPKRMGTIHGIACRTVMDPLRII